MLKNIVVLVYTRIPPRPPSPVEEVEEEEEEEEIVEAPLPEENRPIQKAAHELHLEVYIRSTD